MFFGYFEGPGSLFLRNQPSQKALKHFACPSQTTSRRLQYPWSVVFIRPKLEIVILDLKARALEVLGQEVDNAHLGEIVAAPGL